jgi:hypothetical protein
MDYVTVEPAFGLDPPQPTGVLQRWRLEVVGGESLAERQFEHRTGQVQAVGNVIDLNVQPLAVLRLSNDRLAEVDEPDTSGRSDDEMNVIGDLPRSANRKAETHTIDVAQHTPLKPGVQGSTQAGVGGVHARLTRTLHSLEVPGRLPVAPTRGSDPTMLAAQT